MKRYYQPKEIKFNRIIISSALILVIILGVILITQNSINKKLSEEIEKINITQTKNNNEIIELSERLSKIEQNEDFSKTINKSIISIVMIKTQEKQGAGFLISENGILVTSKHIIPEIGEIKIFDYQENEYSGELIGFNDTFDVALIKTDLEYPPLKLGDSDKAQIGERVIAIGNPLGLQFSVSEGIISALKREGSNNIKAYIQTDTTINQGNSGCPLINTNGEVIGLVKFKVGGGEELGFALESNYLKKIINQIYKESYGLEIIE
jgi:S1-C subfamily serine protease